MLKTLALQLFILAVCCGSFRVSADETIVSKPSAHAEGKTVTVEWGTTAEHSHDGEKRPRLWKDKGAAEVVAALSDYTKVYVFRWEYGELHGQVELESDDSKPLTFDLAPPADFQSDFIGGPHRFPTSGWLAISMREIHDEREEMIVVEDTGDAQVLYPRWGEKYDVRIEQRFTYVDGNKYHTVAFESRRGTLWLVPPDANPKQSATFGEGGSDLSYEVDKMLEGGRITPWLKLKVTEFPSQSRNNDEQSDERKP